jgi:hypothetical protein
MRQEFWIKFTLAVSLFCTLSSIVLVCMKNSFGVKTNNIWYFNEKYILTGKICIIHCRALLFGTSAEVESRFPINRGRGSVHWLG